MVSILVFVDLALEAIVTESHALAPIVVSILVFVDLALEVGYPLSLPSVKSGFNPCFRGSGSRRGTIVKRSGEILGFNPCFRGSGSRRFRSGSIGPSDGVSILVFVDLALEVCIGDVLEVVYVRFNPCFRGSGSRRA